MKRFRLPLPSGMGYTARVFAPSAAVSKVAWYVCELAWRVRGATVYRWPCGTVVVVTTNSMADQRLTQRCVEHLFCVYVRPPMTTVMRDLVDARVSA